MEYNYDNVLYVSKINKLYNIETDFEIGLKKAFEWYGSNADSIVFKENIIQNEEQILRELNYL
ncbi:hypothetical protein [Clostridium frigidicarnis]|uniref:hypothetical protein n=1 Tax=Clostridium frigidicarnis TaxID=84698 RepID=UPI000B7DF481|nr:hypothetical protein [Clostridium frigidicarnis]